MFTNLIDSKTLAKISSLKFKLGLNLTVQFDGLQRSKSRGDSLEFSDHREYVIGDDFRKVDFRTYVSTQKLYVKLFEQERQANFNLFLDMSKSMDWGEKVKKGDLAKAIVACLSYIALGQMDCVRVYLVKEDEIVVSDAFKNNQAFAKLIEFLESAEFDGKANFAKIKEIFLPRRSISIVVSDFLYDDALEVLKMLVIRTSSVWCYQVLDTSETAPAPAPYFYRFIDCESMKMADIESSSYAIKQYSKELKEYQNGLKEFLKKHNGLFFDVLTSDTVEKIIFKTIGVIS